MVLSRSWLALTIPVAIVAVGLLVWTALSLLRTVRRSVVATVPISTEQPMSFIETGTFALNIEGSSLNSVSSDMRFELYRKESSVPIPLRRVLFRTEVSSFRRSRLELYSFSITEAGAYVLRIEGMHRAMSDNELAVVITRPFTGSMIVHILALVVLGICFIGSLVVSGLAIAGTSLTPVS
ncbi:MAG: hypothetical protein ABJB66_02635 [Gemmatimonadaceae bacterium]